MIFGIGTDILRVDRIEAAYARFGEHFVSRLLMPEELPGFRLTRQPARYLGMRFAAKEAIVKAMGTGFANGMWLRDAGILPDARGRPEIIYSDRGKRACTALGIAAGGGYISLSDEAGLIVAVAVLLKQS